MGSRIRLVVSDFLISMMWVWSSVLRKMLVYRVSGFGVDDAKAEVLKSVIFILNMFFFAWLNKLTNGGSYNPLTILSKVITADFTTFFFTVAARIPAQVFGSITGVRLIIETFPEIGRGPHLSVDIHKGALTEGFLTYAFIFLSLGLTVKLPGSFFMKTWITSVSKLSLHILGSDLTGGIMNPASVTGWAYARGDFITKEHIFVYWLAPIEATLLAVWIYSLILQPQKGKAKVKAEKSD